MCWASRPWPGSSTEGLRRRFGSAEISRLHQHFAAPAVDCVGLRRWAPMDPSDSRRLKRFSLKSLLSSCRRPTGCCARLSAVLSFRCWPLACRPDRVNAIVSRLGGCVIRVNVQADGFDLTAQIRGFVETQVLAALGRFDASIALVEVHLGAVRGRATPDKTVCSVIVTLHPHGDVRSIASHAWMNVAITRAACDAGSQVDQELRRRRHTAAPAVGRHENPLELVLDGNRISQWQREMLERPENYLRPVVIRERWANGDGDEHAAPHRNVRPDGPTRDGRRWSRPLTRVS